MAALYALPSIRVSVRDCHTLPSPQLGKCPPCNAVWDGHTLPKLRLGNSSSPRNVVWFGHRMRNRSIITAKAKTETKTKTDEKGLYKRADLDHHHLTNGFPLAFPNGNILKQLSTIDKSSNIVWHQCSIDKPERQQLLQQKGCVIWITGLSGSGKSTVASALSRSLHSRGKLTYVLDGDNVRHGLNKDLSFGPEDRAENIRRIGEVAKLFSDAGLICIGSLISPYKRDRDACRALLPKGDFIEVFMDVPLQICEARDPKGLYKLARAGKIKGFTGIDDPYEQPQNCEIVLRQKPDSEITPCEMAETVVSYLEDHGYLQA